MASWKSYLENMYFNPKNPGAYSGPLKLKHILHKAGFDIDTKKIRQWLQDQDSYSLFQPVKRQFRRERVITTAMDNLWDMDLADVNNLSKYNDNIKYLLIIIDVFSKVLWVEPLKDKSHESVINALKNVFNRTERRPQKIRTDSGAEFKNRWVKSFMKKHGIQAYTTKNETKANFAERVIRTLKVLMYRYFSQKQTYKYMDILQDLVHNYNRSPHSTLRGKSPNEISKSNEPLLWKEMYMDSISQSNTTKPQKYKLSIGDMVRISYLKYNFQRDYQHKWTEEVFKIKNRIRRANIPLYTLTDFDGSPIEGTFYEGELQKVNKDENSEWKIEKILKRRKRNKQNELYVKFRGWPNKFNAWVKEGDTSRL